MDARTSSVLARGHAARERSARIPGPRSSGFFTEYLQNGILPENPFATLDEPGVGRLMQIAVDLGRARRPELDIGICGEHGGDPRSIDLCHRLGLDYVSCSPFRVPVARLAAAHATLAHGKRTARHPKAPAAQYSGQSFGRGVALRS
jgi:hypothetical protein